MKNHHNAVILSDGKNLSPIRDSYDRLSGIIPGENIHIVIPVSYCESVISLIPELPADNILAEPYGRSTAPGLAFAMYHILAKDPEATIIVSPSDLKIEKVSAFQDIVSTAFDFAACNTALVSIGIIPDRADANFGYIQVAGGKSSFSIGRAVKVKTFTEKPDISLAGIFIESGEFLWNSGIFVCRASVLREEMEKWAPRITQQFTGWESRIGDKDFIARVYSEMEKKSIDIAVMEKTEIDWVIPADFGWADIGEQNVILQ